MLQPAFNVSAYFSVNYIFGKSFFPTKGLILTQCFYDREAKAEV